MWLTGIVLTSLSVSTALALNCEQIFESEIRDGNTVYLPNGSDDDHPPQPLPANFNCTYKISAPLGLYAFVNINNGLRGVNDFMIVTDITGQINKLNNRTGMSDDEKDYYFVVPATELSIQVTTKSVFMNSMVLITVAYYTAPPVTTIPMKTGNEMNYLSMGSVDSDLNGVSIATVVGTEPIFVSSPFEEFDDRPECQGCFLIDGTLTNRTSISQLCDLRPKHYKFVTTTTNYVTLVCRRGFSVQLVLNPLSEYEKFGSIFSISSPFPGNVPLWMSSRANSTIGRQAVEVVRFYKTGITFEGITIHSVKDECIAYVVSGPPNNSSEVLLDLSKAKFPHYFDLKYFSIVNEQCYFSFGLKSS